MCSSSLLHELSVTRWHISELWIKYEVWHCWIICPLFCCRLFLYFVSLVDEHNIVCDNLRINLNNVTNCDESRLHRASSLHEVHFGSWYILRYSRWDRGDDSLHLSSTQIYDTFSKLLKDHIQGISYNSNCLQFITWRCLDVMIWSCRTLWGSLDMNKQYVNVVLKLRVMWLVSDYF